MYTFCVYIFACYSDVIMIKAITYPSALKYWLYEDYPVLNAGIAPALSSNERQDKGAVPKQYLEAAAMAGLNLPLHVMVPKASVRIHNNSDLYCHVLSSKLPSGSFVDLGNGVRIISPELCFLLAAQALTFAQLVLLGCDLCAIYARDPGEIAGQRRREPVTTAADINNYLQKVKKVDGINKARQAAKYILDRSNSPRESILAVLMNLPISRGGYRLLEPNLNYDVGLNEAGARMLGRPSCCCDFVWSEQKVVAEYDSNATHLEVDQHYKDKRRFNALILSGQTVISITNEHFASLKQLDELFRLLRKTLGMRAEKEAFEKYKRLRMQVVRELLTFRYSFA